MKLALLVVLVTVATGFSQDTFQVTLTEIGTRHETETSTRVDPNCVSPKGWQVGYCQGAGGGIHNSTDETRIPVWTVTTKDREYDIECRRTRKLHPKLGDMFLARLVKNHMEVEIEKKIYKCAIDREKLTKISEGAPSR